MTPGGVFKAGSSRGLAMVSEFASQTKNEVRDQSNRDGL